jgi:hypothetical protein
MEQHVPGPLKLHLLPRPLVNEMLVVNPMTRTIVDIFLKADSAARGRGSGGAS